MIKELLFQYPFLSLILISFLMTFVIKIISKFTTDQKRLKEIREKLKELQKKSQEASKKGDMKKSGEYTKKMLSLNKEQMNQSFKSLIWTFIPVILFFGLLRGNLSYESLNPGDNLDIDIGLKSLEPFSVDIPYNYTLEGGSKNGSLIVPDSKDLKIKLSNIESERNITFEYLNESHEVELYFGKYTATDLKAEYKPKSELFSSINLGLKPMEYDFLLFKVNWYWGYFILAMVFNIALTKILKIY